MPDPLAALPPRFLRTPEAARFLGLSGRTLEKHRTYGTGPKYRKIGGRVIMRSTISRRGPISAPRAQPPIRAPEPYFPPSGDSSRLPHHSIAADRSRPRARRLKTTAAAYPVMRDITM
jgi:hypothetical protein